MNPSVLVVGAGPVGLVLACELARRGVAIRVVDKLPRPTNESRAVVVHARSLELLERVGVVEELIATGVKTTAMEMHEAGRTLARLALDTVDSPFPFSVTTPQTETERILTARLRALGVEVERGVELTGLTQDDAAVHATLRHADGREEVTAVAWAAGTDGSRSAVRALLGTRLEGSFVGERFLLGDVEAEHDLDRAAMHTFFSKRDAPAIVFPMVGERMRVMAQLDAAEAEAGAPGDAAPTLERLQVIVDERIGGIRLRSAHWLTAFEIHHAQVPRYRHGRVFLAGDAAHVHSPAGGQGMNTGMQDAFNLAWKLALAVDGRGGETLLDSYDAERHPVAARVIELSTRLTRVATLKGELARSLRDHVVHLAAGLAPVQHVLAEQTEETDVAYRASPIVAGFGRRGDGPQPGDAAPDVPASGLRAALLGGGGVDDATAQTVVTVAARDASGPPAPPAGAIDGVRRVLVAADAEAGAGATAPGFDVVLADDERRVATRYGFGRDGGLAVVRPDGYIGLVAELGDDAALARYLDLLR